MTARRFYYVMATTFFVGAVVSISYVAIYFPLTHPGLTETQLFLSNQRWIALSVVLLGIAWLMAKVAEKSADS